MLYGGDFYDADFLVIIQLSVNFAVTENLKNHYYETFS